MRTTTDTIEELGCMMNISLEVDLEYDYDPPEPMVMYYSDGSGFPGSDEYFEFTSFFVTKYICDGVTIKRDEKPDWFKILDKIAENKIMDNEEYYKESALEIYDDEY